MTLADEERKERRDGWGIYRYRPTGPTAERPNVNDQLAFHQSQAKIRVIVGPNRAGKTTPAVAEVAALILGEDYPDWFAWGVEGDCPKPPGTIWMCRETLPVTVSSDSRLVKLFLGFWVNDAASGQRVFVPPMIPRTFLKNPNEVDARNPRVFEFKNGFSLIMKSYRQAELSAAGEEPAFIVPDEPADPGHWYEYIARVSQDPQKRIVHVLTDATENNRTDYLDFLKGSHHVEFFRFTHENPNIDTVHHGEIMDLLPAEQQRIRRGGETTAEVRRCYPFANRWHEDFDLKKKEVLNPLGGRGNWIPKEKQFPIPYQWTKYVVHDPGVTNPGAAAWIAVEPGLENLYVYKGLYWETPHVDFEQTIREIFALCGDERIRTFFIDPKDARKPMQFEYGAYRPRERLKIDSYNRAATRILGRRFRFALAPPSIEMMARATRVAHLTAYLNPNHNACPMIWFFDGDDKPFGDHERMSWQEALKFELDKYHWARSPKGRTNNPDKPVSKHNNFIYCIEVPCAMGFRFVAPDGEDHCVVPVVVDPLDPGGKLRDFMEGGYAQDWNRQEFF